MNVYEKNPNSRITPGQIESGKSSWDTLGNKASYPERAIPLPFV